MNVMKDIAINIKPNENVRLALLKNPKEKAVPSAIAIIYIGPTILDLYNY